MDEAIDATAKHFNLRDAIEDFRMKAEESNDPAEKQRNVERGEPSRVFNADEGMRELTVSDTSFAEVLLPSIVPSIPG